MAVKESTIQKGILDYLELFSRTNNIYYFRAGAGAMKLETGRFFKTGRPGLPDIVALFDGRFIGLEVKTKTGRQSDNQKKAEAEIAFAGGEYYLVRSTADVREILPLN